MDVRLRKELAQPGDLDLKLDTEVHLGAGGLGQLFKNHARLYVYPSLDLDTGHTTTVENFPIAPHLRHLYVHLRENRSIQGLEKFNPDFLPIRSRDVLAKLQAGDAAWEKLVPPPIVEVIKAQLLFGYRGSR